MKRRTFLGMLGLAPAVAVAPAAAMSPGATANLAISSAELGPIIAGAVASYDRGRRDRLAADIVELRRRGALR